MKFHYVASTNDGVRVEGNEEAAGTGELLAVLASKNLKPISIKVDKSSSDAQTNHGTLSGSISINDKIFLTKYLAIMLKIGIDLFQAINILIADFKQPNLKALLSEVRDNLERGQPFYSTFAKYPKYFSAVFINLVKAGEASGNLDSVFEGLSVSFVKEKDLRSKIRGALVYPVILLCMSLVILILLTTFALPKLANIFQGGGFEPPLFSRIVFKVGLFINDNLWVMAGSFLLVLLVGIFSARTLAGRNFLNRMLLKAPIIKTIKFNLAIQRFATTLTSLLRAGVPILESLRITADTISHPDLTESLGRIADEGLAKGLTLGEAFRKEKVFPLVVTNLVAIAEKSGHLDEILDTLGKFYETEIDGSIKTAITFVEPIMLLGIGLVIGTIALAIIVPIYQLISQF